MCWWSGQDISSKKKTQVLPFVAAFKQLLTVKAINFAYSRDAKQYRLSAILESALEYFESSKALLKGSVLIAALSEDS